MSSDYYTVGSVGTRNTTARAETVQAQLQAIDDGLALLPGKLPLQQDRVTYAADTGAANAYVVTLDKVPPAYVAGMRVTFKATAANTGASTINVNSLGTKAIQTFDGSALSSGTIAANQLVTVQYDGTAFRIMSMHGGTSIATLAGISAEIEAVAAIDTEIVAVDANATNINAVASNNSNISAVAGNATNINAVAANETNIDAVAADASDIGTVATNIADVNTCATNIADITANAAGFVSKSGSTMSGELIMADQLLTRALLKDYGEKVNAIGSIGGGTQDIDLTLGNVVTATVDTSTTTFTFSNPTASGDACSFTLILTNGGSQTTNWPASVDWAGATAPTLTASGVDVLTFVTTDGGTTWLGFAAGLDMS